MKERIFLVALVSASLLSACSSSEKAPGSDPAPAMSARDVDEGKNLSNPVPATPESIASGKKFYDRHCADCHGEKADGVSALAAAMADDAVKPPNLIDDQWNHGSTDGDIFLSIRDGVGGPGSMKGLNGRPGVGPNEMWNTVNYLRSLTRS